MSPTITLNTPDSLWQRASNKPNAGASHYHLASAAEKLFPDAYKIVDETPTHQTMRFFRETTKIDPESIHALVVTVVDSCRRYSCFEEGEVVSQKNELSRQVCIKAIEAGPNAAKLTSEVEFLISRINPKVRDYLGLNTVMVDYDDKEKRPECFEATRKSVIVVKEVSSFLLMPPHILRQWGFWPITEIVTEIPNSPKEILESPYHSFRDDSSFKTDYYLSRTEAALLNRGPWPTLNTNNGDQLFPQSWPETLNISDKAIASYFASLEKSLEWQPVLPPRRYYPVPENEEIVPAESTEIVTPETDEVVTTSTVD